MTAVFALYYIESVHYVRKDLRKMLTLRDKSDLEMGESKKSGSLQLAGFYGDHAVFQHGRVFPVRGKAPALTKVELFLAGVHLAVFSNSSGDFEFKVPPLAPAENLEMTITAAGEKVVFYDIAIGNVYLAGGQSNMEFPLKSAVPSVEMLAGKDLSQVRCFALPVTTFQCRASSVEGSWQCASVEQLADFSALAGFFAVELFNRTRIPVGIITATFGGVNIESFISEYSLLTSKVYREEIAAYEAQCAAQDVEKCDIASLNNKLDEAIYRMFPEVPADGGIEKGYCNADFDDSAWDEMLLPDSWNQAGHNHAGIFYFRKKVTLPKGSEKKSFTLHLGIVDKADKTFVNGIAVGALGDCRDFTYWNTLRVYEVAAGVFHEGENIIAVQASSMVSICSDGGLLGPAEEMYLEDDAGEKISLAGKWKMCESFDAGVEGMTCMRRFGQGGNNTFHAFFDNMLAPVYGTALAGVLWYQGEANAICMGHAYHELLSLLIADWRRNFLDPQLHFYIVQLPEFQNPHLFAPFATWPLIREAQALAADENDCTLLVTLGSGDVLNLHPVDKYAVACRAVEVEIARLQGKKSRQVRVKSMTAEADRLILKFDGALALSGKVRGFAVAGRDMVAHAAECEIIDEKTAAVYSPVVAEPFALWYAWAENPRYFELKAADGSLLPPFRMALDGVLPQGKNLIDIGDLQNYDL